MKFKKVRQCSSSSGSNVRFLMFDPSLIKLDRLYTNITKKNVNRLRKQFVIDLYIYLKLWAQLFISFCYFHQDTHLEGKNYIFWALTLAYLSILRMGNQSVTTNPNSNNSSSKIKTAMTEESQFLNYQSIRFVEDSNPPILQQQRCLQGKLDD